MKFPGIASLIYLLIFHSGGMSNTNESNIRLEVTFLSEKNLYQFHLINEGPNDIITSGLINRFNRITVVDCNEKNEILVHRLVT